MVMFVKPRGANQVIVHFDEEKVADSHDLLEGVPLNHLFKYFAIVLFTESCYHLNQDLGNICQKFFSGF
jgi:hypothetical protein